MTIQKLTEQTTFFFSSRAEVEFCGSSSILKAKWQGEKTGIRTEIISNIAIQTDAN